MSALHKIIANVRTALEHKPLTPGNHGDDAALPLAAGTRRLELATQFTRELERVGGVCWGFNSPAAICQLVAGIAHEQAIKRIVIGDGVTFRADALRRPLREAGFEVIAVGAVKDGERAALRDRIATSDLGIVEADYAIAATGTLCVVASSTRPSSLTILPPTNLILVSADRILPCLADVLAAIGAQRLAKHRVAFITGPSRTADIEKMIVIGVHGPKRLYSAILSA